MVGTVEGVWLGDQEAGIKDMPVATMKAPEYELHFPWPYQRATAPIANCLSAGFYAAVVAAGARVSPETSLLKRFRR